MSPETWHAIYTALAFAIGWTCHIGWKMLVSWHDEKKDRTIEAQRRKIIQLQARLDARNGAVDEEAPLPMAMEHDGESVPPSPPSVGSGIQPPAPKGIAARHRRSPGKAKITPIQPFRIDTGKVPQGIGQADLGRMQAQLAAFGACRAVRTGSQWHGRN